MSGAAARFDQAKLDSVNAHYIREADDARLVGLLAGRLEVEFGRALSAIERERLRKGIPGLKPRAKTIVELADKARFYVAPRPLKLATDAAKALTPEARQLLHELPGLLTIRAFASAAMSASDFPSQERPGDWEKLNLETRVRMFADTKGLKLGAVAQPLRAALTGSLASPGIFEVMEVLGREESLGRIADAAIAGGEPA
jgi:glutamyl-tRNA synthetase